MTRTGLAAPALATIPPHVPFLDTLARRWLETQAADPSAGLILLPTRRAARALADAFLHASGGRPMLLPRITAIGALDEAPLALAGALDLPPAVEPLRRLAALGGLVMAAPAEAGGAASADQAWRLARALASLMDEAEQAEVALETALARAHDGPHAQHHAQHWEQTLRFLRIVTHAWPEWLAAEGLANPAARQVALLDAQARAWRHAPPAHPVWAAGLSGALPSVTRLLRVVAGLPRGLVVLPWLDAGITAPPGQMHPQSGLHALLSGIGARAGEVAVWDGPQAAPASRAALLAEALLPAADLHRWSGTPPPAAGALRLLHPADEQEEATAIALVLREALAAPGRRAALVTPDRALAGRVAAELLRWGVVADDSAGEPLAATPQAVFLRLASRAIAEHLSPVSLLATLKHPLAACGLAPAACRSAARALELALRGPRPPPGFAGLRQALARHSTEAAADLVERLRAAMEPALRFVAPQAYRPSDLLRAAIEAAERLAGTDHRPGAELLWAGEEGAALAELLRAALPALEMLPPQRPAVLPPLLDALLEGAVVRGRRALRGRDATAEHPRVFIWGLLEARLQAADVVVLGGLVEGVWPPATDPGPWMSRPMREAAGLPDSDAAIGQAAHDFVMAACCAAQAVLSAPLRRDRAPAVPSRFLARLHARTQAAPLPAHPAVAWARALDLPQGGRGRPAAAPAPRPPAAARPTTYSVTDIGRLMADPFAIYAQRILKLAVLDPLEQDTDGLDYGRLVHRGIELFFRDRGAAWPANARSLLRAGMAAALDELALRPSVAAWWAPQMERIADWVYAEECRRREAAPPLWLGVEQAGAWPLGAFCIRARADRIERLADGTLAILDYKTGAVPGAKQMRAGTAPQLLLEAAMAQQGAFPGVSGVVSELTYWRLTGRRAPGECHTPISAAAELADLVRATPDQVLDLLRDFANPARAYLHRPHPDRKAADDYAHLARAGEAAGAEDEE